MLTSPLSPLMPAVLDRSLLWLNHVLAAEPAATARLARHAGRRVRLQWQAPAGPWPLPPELELLITPAGLVERAEPQTALAAAADLSVSIALPAPHELPALWLAGRRPAITVQGDAQFAADVAWLTENLRWDVEHDLARLIGDGPAHELLRLSADAGEVLRGAARGLGETWSRRRAARAAASR